MKVAVGIVTHNRVLLLEKAILSALAQSYANTEIWVFDDASTDTTPDLKTRFPQVRWLRSDHPEGYLPARNRLMREAKADLYCSLDDDAWFMHGDEISVAVELFIQHPEVAAVAYQILSPDDSVSRERTAAYPTNMFIGCGHMLRLAAVAATGYYVAAPGFYGSEEKDLCVRLLDQSYEIMHLPGVHVWHEKTLLARDLHAQHCSGVCNDLVFTLRRCPSPDIWTLLPGKILSHLRFALCRRRVRPFLDGIVLFIRSVPQVIPSRNPVSHVAFRTYQRRARG
jgi:GT2 family glycosyltransferase